MRELETGRTCNPDQIGLRCIHQFVLHFHIGPGFVQSLLCRDLLLHVQLIDGIRVSLCRHWLSLIEDFEQVAFVADRNNDFSAIHRDTAQHLLIVVMLTEQGILHLGQHQIIETGWQAIFGRVFSQHIFCGSGFFASEYGQIFDRVAGCKSTAGNSGQDECCEDGS